MQKIILIGHLGKDQEERTTASGKKLISFSIAVKITKDNVQWYTINIWQDKIDLFKSILPYLKKGSKIHVIGDMNAPTIYTNKNNEQSINMSVTPFSISFVSSAEEKPKSEIAQQQVELPFTSTTPTPSWQNDTQQDDLPF